MNDTIRREMPGSGMSVSWYVLLTAFSIVLFVLWGGVLWAVPAGTSHLGRFAVSYLAVPPLAGLLLLALRRFSWARLATATMLVWSVKLLVTAALYYALVGARPALPSVAPPATAARVAAVGRALPVYMPAATPFAGSTLSGSVVRDGSAVAGALVFLVTPAPGLAMAAPRRVDLVIRALAYETALAVLTPADSLHFTNLDPVLHNVHLHGAGRVSFNRPVASGVGSVRIPVPAPGVYRAGCDAHSGESATLVVLDHPYWTTTDERGAFTLEAVPPGDVKVRAIAPVPGEAPATTGGRVALAAGRDASIALDLAHPDTEVSLP